MQLFYREFGTSKPLLILHGLFGLSDHWIGVAKRLSSDFRVIIPDLRNHGQSLHHHEMNLEAMSNDILELLQKLNISKIMVIGHSMGGKLATMIALQHPQIVEKLMVIDIGIKDYTLSEEMQAISAIMQQIIPESFKNRQKLYDTLSCPENIKQLITKNLKSNSSKSLSWKPNIFVIMKNLDRLLSKINHPIPYTGNTIFLHGEFSDYILPGDVTDIIALFPESKFISIPHSGHWIHVDNPDALILQAMKFFF